MPSFEARQTEPHLWTTGFTAPDGTWHPEMDHGHPAAARDRAAWLNGPGDPATRHVHLRSEPFLWTVGRYAGDWWQPVSDHDDKQDAARKTAELNGSDPDGWKDEPTQAPLSPGETEAAVRARMARTGCDREQALHDVEVITEIAEEDDLTYADAEAWYDAPENQVMCEACGWTCGMACPECAKGCGCEYRCTGWRHREWNYDDDDDIDDGCPECGAGGPGSGPYDECTCYE